MTRGFVRAQVEGERWTTWGDHLVLMSNGPPSRAQLMWMAVLDAGPPALLAGHTALELAGFSSFAREAEQIHLVIPRGARSAPLPGVRVHESRRLRSNDGTWSRGLPRTGTARSALDAAAWQPFPRFACALVAAVVQQRLCTVTQLEEAMEHIGRIRHKAYLRLALADIETGATASGELEVGRMCRRFGLELPRRQVARCGSDGRARYLDCEWELPGGGVVVLEVDGRHHMEVSQWEADMRRERSVVISGRKVLRATNLEVRLDPGPIASDLLAVGVRQTRLVSVGGRSGSHSR